MKNKNIFTIHKKWRYLSLVACSVVALVLTAFFIMHKVDTPKDVDATTASNVDSPERTKQTMNVLVVEINPHLNTVAGHPKVSDYIYSGESYSNRAKTTIDETVADLEFVSGGYLDIKTTWDYLDEFPTYKNAITMPDGTSAKRLNEANFLAATGGQSGADGYWNIINSEWIKQISTGDFDYNYLIDKLDLVSRRENGEFDQVWIVYIEPSGAYETMMVGRTSYWINGSPVTADCDNFVIAGFNIERRDSQLHALGHSYEGIMNRVYGSRFNTYDANAKNSINISTKAQYLELNLWERFTLNDYVNAGTINGVGTVHHPYNARDGYDYSNTAAVNTTYHEWSEPILNMTGEFLNKNSSVWNSTPFNDGGPDLTSGRYYMRFWMRHFPRETGYTSDGYLKNWWKYFFSLRHVKSATAQNSTITLDGGQDVTLNYQVTYDSGEKQNKSLNKKYDNVSISNNKVVGVKDGKLSAKGAGQSTITVYIEGKPLEYVVNVNKSSQTVSFLKDSITKTNGDSSFTNAATTTGDGTITYTSSNKSVATVNSNSGLVSIVGEGSTTITATASSTDNYTSGSASYTLIVEAAQSDDGTNGGGENTGNTTNGDENSGSSTGSNTGSSTGSNTGSNTGSSTGSNTGSSTGSNTGSNAGSDTSSDSDINTSSGNTNNTNHTSSNNGSDANSGNQKDKHETVSSLPATLPDTSDTRVASEENDSKKVTIVSSVETVTAVPDTGSSTKGEDDSSSSYYAIPAMTISVLALLYTQRRRKSHRRFD